MASGKCGRLPDTQLQSGSQRRSWGVLRRENDHIVEVSAPQKQGVHLCQKEQAMWTCRISDRVQQKGFYLLLSIAKLSFCSSTKICFLDLKKAKM